MSFNVYGFTNDDTRTYDIGKNFGELTYLGLEMEPVVNEDTGEIVGELPSHVQAYSSKEDDIFSFKLTGDTSKLPQLAIGTKIQPTGKTSLHIYSWRQNTARTRTNDAGEIEAVQETRYAFVPRIEGFKAIGGEQKPAPQPPKEEHKG